MGSTVIMASKFSMRMKLKALDLTRSNTEILGLATGAWPKSYNFGDPRSMSFTPETNSDGIIGTLESSGPLEVLYLSFPTSKVSEANEDWPSGEILRHPEAREWGKLLLHDRRDDLMRVPKEQAEETHAVHLQLLRSTIK